MRSLARIYNNKDIPSFQKTYQIKSPSASKKRRTKRQYPNGEPVGNISTIHVLEQPA